MMQRFQDFRSDEQGAISVWLAGGMTAIIGVGALAVDVGNLYMQETRLQIAGDTAALAAASVVGEGEQAMRDAAIYYVEQNLPSAHFGTVLAAQDVVTGTWDDGTASFTPAAGGNAVQLTLRRTSASGNPVNNFLSAVVGYDSMDIVTQVTATGAGGQPGCIMALDPGSTSDSLKFSSMGSVELNDCVPAANSTSSNAIKVSSLDSFHAGSLYAVGQISIPGYLESGLDEPPQEDQDPAADPYGNLPNPTYGGCDYNNHNAGSSISPGVYCGGLSASGSSLTVQPGTYYIVDGDLDFSSMNSVTCNCTAPGSGVTFVITGSTPAQIGKFEISSINTVNLRAPKDASYDYTGMLIYVDRRAPYQLSKFSQIDNVTFNGALYAPSQELNINSIDYTVQTDCMWIVGYNVNFNSIDAFGRTDNCSAYGTKQISVGAGGGGGPRLVQ